MTNEKAIKMLEYIRRTGNGEGEYKNDAQAIAIDMAIEALKMKYPCDLCRWDDSGEDEYCWECQAQHKVEEGAYE